MASCHLLYFLILFSLVSGISASNYSMSALNCTKNLNTCTAFLYHINSGLTQNEIASYYSLNISEFISISHKNSQDYLIKVPCSCKDVNGTTGYFYDTNYKVKNNGTFIDVSNHIYSGQALDVGGEENLFNPDAQVPMHLLCGCVEEKSLIIVTYTVQQGDTLLYISSLLSARLDDVVGLNTVLDAKSGFIDVGWVLFFPKEINGIPQKGKSHIWEIIIGILSALTLISMVVLLIILIRRRRFKQKNGQKGGRTIRASGSKSTRRFSEQSQFMYTEYTGDITIFESDRPVVFSLDEIEEATSDFDETKIIGVGGYGSVYHGTLITGQEIAVKKMRSNKSKEFFAELKVLCKIHHINVVELLGYAAGDDHLYLIYEYVQNGSLNDHLHDPLLKGNQPLSWTARTHIALDSAKGIEYNHDHTKALYVHRDIKTSNILLDKSLRAKVGDFGLAKLVERTSDEDLIATRLVGTPGYLPPESVKELQITPKADVFAFGVVLAELITGQRALVRDNRERNKMKSLITTITKVFQDEDPESALEDVIDGNLRGSYPIEDVYKV